MTMNLFEQIRTRPWNSRYFAVPGFFRNFPTMLTQEEMRMLAWLAKHADQPGVIVDLGCFLGGSTVSLAWGTHQAPEKKPIHSYDRFGIDERLKHTFLYKRGHSFFEGTDALPIFEHFTQPYKDLISVHPGDVRDADYDGSPISILFIDLSKSFELNDLILDRFFPHLTAGSVIVQQDFLFFRNPWLLSTMMLLSDKVELLSYTEDYSVIFGVVGQIERSDIEACLSTAVEQDCIVRAIDYYIERFPFTRQKEMLIALRESYLSKPSAVNSWEFPNVTNIRASFEANTE